MSKSSASPEVNPVDAAETSANTPKTPVAAESKEKKKKKYSSSLARTAQELESGLTKSARKVAKAVREGLDEYAVRSEESAGEKKDGVLRDHLRNQSKALRKALPIAAEVPADILDTVADLKVVRKMFRK